MFDQIARRFLNNLFEPKPPVFTVPKKIVYFSLPFTGLYSLQIRTQITRLCSAAYPHLNTRFNLSFALLPVSPLSFLLRIEFPSFIDTVL